MLAAATIERFRRDGYVVVDGLLTDDELAHYEPLVTTAVAQRKSGDTRSLAEKSLYEQSFLQCINLWEDYPAVRPLTFHPKVGQAAAELIGTRTSRTGPSPRPTRSLRGSPSRGRHSRTVRWATSPGRTRSVSASS